MIKKIFLCALLLICSTIATNIDAQTIEELEQSLEHLQIKLSSLAGSLDNVTTEQTDGAEEEVEDDTTTQKNPLGSIAAALAAAQEKLTKTPTTKPVLTDEKRFTNEKNTLETEKTALKASGKDDVITINRLKAISNQLEIVSLKLGIVELEKKKIELEANKKTLQDTAPQDTAQLEEIADSLQSIEMSISIKTLKVEELTLTEEKRTIAAQPTQTTALQDRLAEIEKRLLKIALEIPRLNRRSTIVTDDVVDPSEWFDEWDDAPTTTPDTTPATTTTTAATTKAEAAAEKLAYEKKRKQEKDEFYKERLLQAEKEIKELEQKENPDEAIKKRIARLQKLINRGGKPVIISLGKKPTETRGDILASIRAGLKPKKPVVAPDAPEKVDKTPTGMAAIFGRTTAKYSGVGLPELSRTEHKEIENSISDAFVDNFLKTKRTIPQDGEAEGPELEPALFNMWLDGKLASNIYLTEAEIEFYNKNIPKTTPPSDDDNDDDDWGESELSEDEIKAKMAEKAQFLKEYIYRFFDSFVGQVLSQPPYSSLITFPENWKDMYTDDEKYKEVALVLEKIEKAILNADDLIVKEEFFTDKNFLQNNLKTLTLALLSPAFKNKLAQNTTAYLQKNTLKIIGNIKNPSIDSDITQFMKGCFDNNTQAFKNNIKRCKNDLEKIRSSYFNDIEAEKIKNHKDDLITIINTNKADLQDSNEHKFYEFFENIIKEQYADYEEIINDNDKQKDFIITNIEIDKLNKQFLNLIDTTKPLSENSNAPENLYRRFHTGAKIQANLQQEIQTIEDLLNKQQATIQQYMQTENDKLTNPSQLLDHRAKLKAKVDEFNTIITDEIKPMLKKNNAHFNNNATIVTTINDFNNIMKKSTKIHGGVLYKTLETIKNKLVDEIDAVRENSEKEKSINTHLAKIQDIEDSIEDQNNEFTTLQAEEATVKTARDLTKHKLALQKSLKKLKDYFEKTIQPFLNTEYFKTKGWVPKQGLGGKVKGKITAATKNITDRFRK